LEWKRERVVVHLVNQKIAEVDVDGVWEKTARRGGFRAQIENA
jgi:hypothetical protein